jgi:NTE family protein
MRTHRIMTDKLAEFGASNGKFLAMLKQEGRKSAGDFLTSCGANLGTKSSADLDVLLMEC